MLGKGYGWFPSASEYRRGVHNLRHTFGRRMKIEKNVAVYRLRREML